MMRDRLITFVLDYFGKELLDKAAKQDEVANGIQLLGSEEVKKVALGVSLNEDFLKEAVRIGASLCIVHHGFDPRVYKGRFPRSSQKRLKLILNHDLTIIGFHYVLDADPRIGNNAVIIKLLGAKLGEPLFEEFGYVAHFEKPKDAAILAEQCAEIFHHDIFAVYSGPKKVKTIGVVSGAAKPSSEHLTEMEEKGIELFLTGEASESVPSKMAEEGINYFACGHYATEVFGVQELGKVIKSRFEDGLEVEFIDIPNPI
ncbi:MAG: hypothetical protein A3F04_00955 [Candidatus Chisholmbacteria bacterium RIFCSPHIGHO2_12_FULL_49_9]|nr:MAG: hypothetical protein A3F04_00955 [Candidatus Chisholmbacteria bacterium RIFCSPHIGHO2_12_FULL_49_9]